MSVLNPVDFSMFSLLGRVDPPEEAQAPSQGPGSVPRNSSSDKYLASASKQQFSPPTKTDPTAAPPALWRPQKTKSPEKLRELEKLEFPNQISPWGRFTIKLQVPKEKYTDQEIQDFLKIIVDLNWYADTPVWRIDWDAEKTCKLDYHCYHPPTYRVSLKQVKADSIRWVLPHEIGHHIYHQRKLSKNSQWQRIYRKAKREGLDKALDDTWYRREAYDSTKYHMKNANEFFATSVLTYYRYGEEFAKRIQDDDKLSEEERALGREVWHFLKDNIFKGKTFLPEGAMAGPAPEKMQTKLMGPFGSYTLRMEGIPLSYSEADIARLAEELEKLNGMLQKIKTIDRLEWVDTKDNSSLYRGRTIEFSQDASPQEAEKALNKLFAYHLYQDRGLERDKAWQDLFEESTQVKVSFLRPSWAKEPRLLFFQVHKNFRSGADYFLQWLLDPNTPEAEREFGLKLWDFMLDSVFDGKVFTSHGYNHWDLSEGKEYLIINGDKEKSLAVVQFLKFNFNFPDTERILQRMVKENPSWEVRAAALDAWLKGPEANLAYDGEDPRKKLLESVALFDLEPKMQLKALEKIEVFYGSLPFELLTRVFISEISDSPLIARARQIYRDRFMDLSIREAFDELNEHFSRDRDYSGPESWRYKDAPEEILGEDYIRQLIIDGLASRYWSNRRDAAKLVQLFAGQYRYHRNRTIKRTLRGARIRRSRVSRWNRRDNLLDRREAIREINAALREIR